MKYICQNCQKVIIVKASLAKKRKYCSLKCYQPHIAQERKLPRETRICPTCNKTYICIIGSKQKFCSLKCTRIIKKCIVCKKVFIKNRHAGKSKYCSVECKFRRVHSLCKVCKTSIYHHFKRKYCSKQCEAVDYRKQLKGKGNPNFGNGDAMRKAWRNGKFDKIVRKHPGYSYGNGGYYKNIWMRSSWEIEYAKFLDKKHIVWQYEKKIFVFANGKRYLPDFYLPKLKEWHEVKGWMDKRSRTKIHAFRKEYPQEKLVIIDREIWK